MAHHFRNLSVRPLVERYCELFGTWPACAQRAGGGVKARARAELELADRRVAECRQRIALQRRRVTEQERLGSDIRLSARVLLNFEATFQLMVGYPRALTGKIPD